MGKLAEWSKKNSKFIKLDDKETFVGKFIGYSFMLGKDGKEVPVYKFKTSEGDEKLLQSTSKALVKAFDDNGTYKVGTVVSITRHGLMAETTYEIAIADQII